MNNSNIQIKNKNIRLFISSTFADFTEERRILNEKVLPAVTQYCEERGFVFQTVDLRYGVPLSASEDHTTMKICLEEVARCRNTGYYLNFLMMIGNRYGYTPEPSEIYEKDFEILLKWCENTHCSMTEIVKAHYRLDENCLNPSYVFNTGANTNIEDRNKLQKLFKTAYLSDELQKELGVNRMNEYFLSATGQEIWKGMMTVDDNEFLKHIICVFRNESGDADRFEYKDKALSSLVSGVRKHYSKHNIKNVDPVFEYIRDSEKDESYYEQFRMDMLSAVKRIADDSIKQYISSNLSDQLRHEIFLKSYLKIPFDEQCELDKIVIGRNDELQELLSDIEINEPENRLCVVSGESGKGKTYLMALSIFSIIQESTPEDIVIYRFVGGTPGSNNPLLLIESTYKQLCYELGVQPSEHLTYSRSCDALKYLINEYFGAQSKRKLYLIIDATDQIALAQNEEKYLWIPDTIPDNVRYIISCNEPGLNDISVAHKVINLGSLNENEICNAIRRLLSAENRCISETQMSLVQSAYKKVDRPIYLNYLVNIVRYWHSWDSYDLNSLGVLDCYLSPEEYINGTLQLQIRGLQRKYGEALVSYTLGFILVSENGLMEKELIQLLALTEEVISEYALFFHVKEKELARIKEVGEIPYMVWSRLYYNIRSSLKEVELDSLVLYDFYHMTAVRAVRTILGESFIERCRDILCKYFYNKNYYLRDSKAPNIRKLSELTYQCCETGRTDMLYDLITDSEYVVSMYESNRINQLIDVLKRVWKSNNEERRQIAKKFFSDTISFFVHNSITAPFLEMLHSLLAFDEDPDIRELHRTIFELGFDNAYLESEISKVYCGNDCHMLAKVFELQCKTKRLNSLRRIISNQAIVKDLLIYLEGDSGVSVLDGYINEINLVSAEQQKYIYEELSRMYYEIAYVNYLSGDSSDAKKYMKESISYARKSNNEVSMWISKLVWFQIVLYSDCHSKNSKFFLKSFISNVNQALDVFNKNSSDNENASRWVSNAEVYLVQGYYFDGDIVKTEYYATKYENSSWIKNNLYSKRRLKPYYLIMRNDSFAVSEALEQLTSRLEKARERGIGFSVEFIVLDIYLVLVAANRLLEIGNTDFDYENIDRVMSPIMNTTD